MYAVPRVERRIRHGIRMIHTKTLAAGLYQTSALPSLAAFGRGDLVGASACAVAYMRRTRGVIGRVDCGAIDGREMYITVVSSATWNSHTPAYMHSSQITEIQHHGTLCLSKFRNPRGVLTGCYEAVKRTAAVC